MSWKARRSISNRAECWRKPKREVRDQMAHILFVEDHPDVHRFLCDRLLQAGHAADCVSTVAEAKEALGSKRYDLVITDVRLTDGSGHDIAAAASDLGIKTLLMSGHPDELQILTVSGVEHLVKPFRVSDFMDVISRRLGP